MRLPNEGPTLPSVQPWKLRQALHPAGTLMAVCIALVVLVPVVIESCAWAHTSDARCETIKDSDARNMCRATSGNDPSWCEFIKNAALRTACRVKTGENR